MNRLIMGCVLVVGLLAFSGNAMAAKCKVRKTSVEWSLEKGACKGGYANGQGRAVSPDGRSYVGGFMNGLFHGQGTLTLEDGHKYVGGWKDGKTHGHGVGTWPGEGTFVGESKDGRRHGQGTLTLKSGYKYTGGWKAGKTPEEGSKMHGRGTLTTEDGNKYVGNWRDGKRYGQGELTLPLGLVFKGQWGDDAPQGSCVFKNKKAREPRKLYTYGMRLERKQQRTDALVVYTCLADTFEDTKYGEKAAERILVLLLGI